MSADKPFTKENLDYLNAFSEAEGEEQLKKLVDFCVELQGEFADSLALEFGNTPSWVHNAG